MNMQKLARKVRKLLDRVRPARRAAEVVLISYPKSGRTWVRFMLNTAGVHIDYSHAGADNRLGLPFAAIADRVNEWTDRRIIFLTRDPRDTVVSCYFQATRRIAEEARFEGDLGTFIRDPGYGIDKIARFNLHWMESAHLFRDFMSVSYEALHASGADVLAHIMVFATGHPADPSKVRQACAAGRFENMREVEVRLGSSEDDVTRLGGGVAGDVESFKTRKGQVGGWTDYLDAADVAYCETVLNELNYFERLEALRRRGSAGRG